ncbi:MAG TPA: hypothetical protein VNK49_09255 [Anaerolineales bacterium]|nr:hypothetical protein [Anaerolineales bacterium]
MLENIKREFSWITWLLIPMGIMVNGVGGWLIAKSNLPLYLDSIGTIFLAVVSGPISGALTGVLTNILFGLVSPAYIPYWPVPLCMGLVAGFSANAGLFKNWRGVVVTGFLVALTAAGSSTLVVANLYGSVTPNLFYFFVQEPVDKILTALIAFGIARNIPERLRARLPRPENITGEKR